jgi:hypothetical protein
VIPAVAIAGAFVPVFVAVGTAFVATVTGGVAGAKLAVALTVVSATASLVFDVVEDEATTWRKCHAAFAPGLVAVVIGVAGLVVIVVGLAVTTVAGFGATATVDFGPGVSVPGFAAVGTAFAATVTGGVAGA